MQQVVIAGRYRLLELIGRGGMGRVWRARDEMLHREVAVKQVAPPHWLGPEERDELRGRTLREARTAARLSHPHVVHVYDVVQVDGDPWLVMEYVPSRSLQDIVDTDGPLDPRRAARIGLAVLAALRAAHAAGVLHRDVKPANVLLARDGRVLLTDFGLAVFDGGDGAMTRPGLVLGSPQYVAPERAAEGVSSVETDLWSLGATLHAAVEGRSPYARTTAMATLSALASQPPDPAPHAGPLAPVLAGLLRRDPSHRLRHDGAARLLTAAAAPAAGPAPTTYQRDPAGDPEIRPRADRAHRPATLPAASTAHDTPSGSGGDPGPGDPSRPGDPTEPGGRSEPGTAGPGAGPSEPRGAAGPGAGPGASPAGDHGPDRRRAALRRWGLATASCVLAVAAGVGTALAVTSGSDERPPGEPWGEPPTGEPWQHAPPPPGPPPDGGPVPPPPFPCVRRDVAGEPVTAGTPPADRTVTPPAGWIWYGDHGGFGIAVPAGWRHLRWGDTTCFQDPATRRILGVELRLGSADPVAQLRTAERDLIEGGRLPGYERIRLTAVDGGAEWECRWTTPYGERMHALRVLPGHADGWTLGWTTRDADWDASLAQLSIIRRGFQPSGATRSTG